MSIESAKAFLEKTESDESLRGQLAGIDSEAQFFQAINQAGFDLTKEELESAVQAHQPNENLTEEDLQSVAGGTVTTAAWMTRLLCGQKTQPTIFPCADPHQYQHLTPNQKTNLRCDR